MSTQIAASTGRRILQLRRPAAPEAPALAPAFDGNAISLDSAALLRGHKTVQIQHNGFVYSLQATRLGKLILTK